MRNLDTLQERARNLLEELKKLTTAAPEQTARVEDLIIQGEAFCRTLEKLASNSRRLYIPTDKSPAAGPGRK